MHPVAAQRVRQIALALSGLTLIVIAAIAIPFPRLVASGYGISLEHAESFNEFRAVFIGFWIGQGTLMITAARRTDIPLLGSLCALLIFLQAGGRALSFVLDGTLEARFVLAFAAEIAAGLAIVVPPRLARRAPPGR